MNETELNLYAIESERADRMLLRADAAEARCSNLLEANREQAEAIETLRAERDDLLSKINELAQRNSDVLAQRNESYATVAEQARKLEEARNTMTRALELLESIYMQSSGKSATVLALRACLSANTQEVS